MNDEKSSENENRSFIYYLPGDFRFRPKPEVSRQLLQNDEILNTCPDRIVNKTSRYGDRDLKIMVLREKRFKIDTKT